MTEGQPWYFEVSTAKFVVMSTVTFGIYGFYLYYHLWRDERARTGEYLSPFWRTFFSPFTCFSLFRRMSTAAQDAGAGPFAHRPWAIAYVVSLGTAFLPKPWSLISIFGFLPMIPAQAAATRVNRLVAPGAPRNDHYSGLNVAMIVIGILMYLLVLASLVLPPVAEAQTVKPDSLGFIVAQPEDVQPREGGTQVVLAGDPAKPGVYVIRLRFGPGQMSRPHFHDQDRFVTVIKGTWWISLGPSSAAFDTSRMTPMKTGSFVKHPAGGVHFDGAKTEETIVQIIGTGPVRTVRVNADGTPVTTPSP